MLQAIDRRLADPFSFVQSFSYTAGSPTAGCATRSFSINPTLSFSGDTEDQRFTQEWEAYLRPLPAHRRDQFVTLMGNARDHVDEEAHRVEVLRAAQPPNSSEGIGPALADAHDGALNITVNLENSHRDDPQAAHTSTPNTAKKTNRTRGNSNPDVPKGDAEEDKTDDREPGQAIGSNGASGSSGAPQNRLSEP
jgi:hypothetical protein